MNSHLRIRSDRSVPVTVWVEPWGRDYTLLPEEEVLFTAAGAGPDFSFHVSWQEKDILLYAEGGCEDVTVYRATQELECGHQRHHRTDRVF